MEFDARGLKCPVPIIKLSATLKTLPIGGELRVIANDRGFPSDVRAWCDKTGHLLVSMDETDASNLIGVVRRMK